MRPTFEEGNPPVTHRAGDATTVATRKTNHTSQLADRRVPGGQHFFTSAPQFENPDRRPTRRNADRHSADPRSLIFDAGVQHPLVTASLARVWHRRQPAWPEAVANQTAAKSHLSIGTGSTERSCDGFAHIHRLENQYCQVWLRRAASASRRHQPARCRTWLQSRSHGGNAHRFRAISPDDVTRGACRKAKPLDSARSAGHGRGASWAQRRRRRKRRASCTYFIAITGTSLFAIFTSLATVSSRTSKFGQW